MLIFVLVLVLVLWLVLAFVLAFVLALVLALELVLVASASIWHLAASGLAASGSIWDHLGSSVPSEIIWQHLGAPGIIWRHLAASELAASGGIWDPPAASGSIWDPLAASGSIWHHLGCPAERSELWKLEIETWAGNQVLEAGNRETASIFVKLSTKIGF